MSGVYHPMTLILFLGMVPESKMMHLSKREGRKVQ